MSVSALMLSACSTTLPPAAPPIQQNLLTRCPETLPALTDGTGRDVVLTMREWAGQYQRCAIRHNGLVDALTATEATDEKAQRPAPATD
ncbi:Rz1-like lysis system protein LysC [Salinicola aestuarinus]|uniref:Rz1-like lysis system protein LysC n=1 Tax=Salinicola aestuarinus TaxID=1949082 RepID=UPI003CC92820